ncbi:hypothetical protein DMB65_04035 [Flavobacterium cheongpyeongense]|uniref:Uncharacterized protein n=1 Tax=Flavobacterium cheongpyeongense TaxID=2212651 RepID=A0A2V4BTQ0_9FLAO|nr:hypothetical protein [Flavobacterium cheongpyeongense]PXY42406.1 hypothetical protein DMB65_04035 [Flavobacterium cheongpyeongense]
MNTHADKIQKNKNQPVANAVTQKKNNGNQTFALEDNRTNSIVQKKLETIENNSDVAQLGKKKRDLERAKKNNPNGLQHHNRPEYQDVNERQMELIKSGVNKKDAKRQAKEEIKKK